MVKAPSQHGLERKFRPWRKGKSTKAKKQGSLKHQLRGQERLLGMILKKKKQRGEESSSFINSNNDSDEQEQQKQIREIQNRIKSLKEQITEKEMKERERENAKKSHGARFLERQRLTKMERHARKLLQEHQHHDDKKKEQAENELFKIAMDQIYVAHYPCHNKSYKQLFRNGQRHLHHSVSRATIRQQIISDLQKKKIERVKWISNEQYERIPKTWSVQDEITIFEYPSNTKNRQSSSKTTDDDRFAMTLKHESLLEKASELESKLAKEENLIMKQDKNGGSSNSDDDANSGSEQEDEQVNDAIPGAAAKRKREKMKSSDSEEDSSNDSDSSDDEADPIAGYKDSQSTTKNNEIIASAKKESDKKLNKIAGLNERANDIDENKSVSSSSSDSDSSSSSSSDSDSDSSSSSDDDDDDERATNQPNHTSIIRTNTNNENENDGNSDSEDDFFVKAKESKEDDIEVFDKVKDKPDHALPAENPARGDKSQGWATQRQRPGQFKKKRTRR